MPEKPLYPMPLADFVKHTGKQKDVAAMLGIHTSTLSLMLSRGRSVFVKVGPNGLFAHYEVKHL